MKYLYTYMMVSFDTLPEQAAYLDRQKLLSDEERESLPGDAFEPVSYVPD